MDNLERLATLGTQDTGRRHTKQNKKQKNPKTTITQKTKSNRR